MYGLLGEATSTTIISEVVGIFDAFFTGFPILQTFFQLILGMMFVLTIFFVIYRYISK